MQKGDEQKLINCKQSQTKNEGVGKVSCQRADDGKYGQMKSQSSWTLSIPASFESWPKVFSDTGSKNVSNNFVVFGSIVSDLIL